MRNKEGRVIFSIKLEKWWLQSYFTSTNTNAYNQAKKKIYFCLYKLKLNLEQSAYPSYSTAAMFLKCLFNSAVNLKSKNETWKMYYILIMQVFISYVEKQKQIISTWS